MTEIENWQIGDDGLPTMGKEPMLPRKQGSMRSGYAFSQEEGGSVSQVKYLAKCIDRSVLKVLKSPGLSHFKSCDFP